MQTLGLSLFDRNVTKYFKETIYDAIKTREEKGIVRKDMINLLLETRKGIKAEVEEATETGYATVKESSALGLFFNIILSILNMKQFVCHR